MWGKVKRELIVEEIPKMIKGKKIYVGGLGNAVISKRYGFIDVHFIKEGDEGTKSWQLLVDENRGDRVLKSVKVFPLDRETIGLALDEPQAFGLSPMDKDDLKIYNRLDEILKELKNENKKRNIKP